MTLDEQPPPAPRVTVQCAISRAAAEAIELDTIKFRAREAGIENASLEASSYRAPGGRIRITTELRVAIFIMERLRERIKSTDGELMIACAEAAGALLKAMDEGLASSRAPMSSWFPKNPPTRESRRRPDENP